MLSTGSNDPIPEVSVVVPTRNRAPRLRRTLETVVAQEGVTFEVILVDDKSSDSTAGAMRILAAADHRIRLVWNNSRLGLAKSRNAGLAVARGEWVAFLDDDDVWSPQKLRIQLDEAARTGRSWAFAGVLHVDDELVPTAADPAGDGETVLDRLLVEPAVPAGGSNVIARTATVLALGGFDENLAHLADWDLWIRLAQQGPAAACSQILVGYVRHDDNMHLDADIEEAFAELDRLRSKYAHVRQERGVTLDERRFGHWVAAGHRDAGRHWRASRVYLRLAVRHKARDDFRYAVRSMAAASVRRPARSPAGLAAPSWLKDIGSWH